MPAFDPDRQILEAVELFCYELYLRRCPPMTKTDLRSFYMSLKEAIPRSTWPSFEVLIDAVEQSLPEAAGMVLIRDHYLCGACSHVFITKQAFSGHLSSVEHLNQARLLCEAAQPASNSLGATFRCPLKGCSQRFNAKEALFLHAAKQPHNLFFVARTSGSNSYACINCSALFQIKRSLVEHAASCGEPSTPAMGEGVELEITCSSPMPGVMVTKTASGFEIAQFKAKGRVVLKCGFRNVTQMALTITSVEFVSPELPTFVLDHNASELSTDAARGRNLVLRPGLKLNFQLTAENLGVYSYGFYGGTLHAVYVKPSSEEVVVLDWAMTLEVISEEHEELKPISKFEKKKINSWLSVRTVDGRPPLSGITNRLEQIIPLPDYEVPPDVRFLREQALPDVARPLSPSNYQSKMESLLYLEELALERMMMSYTLESASLQEDQDYFQLEIPGLAEQKPRLKIGAKLRVSPVVNTSESGSRSIGYIGYVYDIDGVVVRLRFAGRFQQCYMPGMKFIIEFPLHRQNLQLYHRALRMAVTNAGLMNSVIFPTSHLGIGANEHLIATASANFGIRTKNRLVEENPEQLKAVAAIVHGTSLPHPYVIFGPPGTGKTTTIVEAIKQVYFRLEKSRVLVCTPQNNAADLVAKRLLEHVPPAHVIRLNAIHRKKSDVLYEAVAKISNYELSGEVFFPSVAELSGKRIVVCTLTTCGRLVSAGVDTSFFTHIFIDESGQAIEPEALVPVAGLLRSGSAEPDGQLVLAGDPKQLGPVLQSAAARSNGLGTSMLERLMTTCCFYAKNESLGHHDGRYACKLLKNFRSHPEILHISNELFYERELQSCADQREREKFCSWSELPKRGFPIIMHDIGGRDNRESSDPSYFNIAEVETVVDYMEKLLCLHSPRVKPDDVGIISPYKKQVRKIQQVIVKRFKGTNPPIAFENIKVGSVEEFQGQERSVIIISTVRAESSIGFVGDAKRFNVAITRAKSLLIVIGNLKLLSTSGPWKSLIDYCREKGGVRAARV